MEEEYPCKKCILRPVCNSKTQIECTNLFEFVVSNSDFESPNYNRIISREVRSLLKKYNPNVKNIKPEKNYGRN